MHHDDREQQATAVIRPEENEREEQREGLFLLHFILFLNFPSETKVRKKKSRDRLNTTLPPKLL